MHGRFDAPTCTKIQRDKRKHEENAIVAFALFQNRQNRFTICITYWEFFPGKSQFRHKHDRPPKVPTIAFTFRSQS